MANWKTIAIVFIILFTLETSIFVISVVSVMNEDKKIMECFYDVCEEYPEADYDEGLCTCYDYDVLGEFYPAKYEVMD